MSKILITFKNKPTLRNYPTNIDVLAEKQKKSINNILIN
jgi:hypothetical protein